MAVILNIIKMKKLQNLNSSLFIKFENNELHNSGLSVIRGGAESGTKEIDRATSYHPDGSGTGCAQADVWSKDKRSDVGTVQCPDTVGTYN